MAAEKRVKLANLGVEMFQMGLIFQGVYWIPGAGFICYALWKSLNRRNLTHENFQNLEGL